MSIVLALLNLAINAQSQEKDVNIKQEEKIQALDCHNTRFVYFNGINWDYIWLDDQLTKIVFIHKSDFSPRQYKYNLEPKNDKVVVGKVEIGALIKN